MERIENKRSEKTIKLLKWGAIMTFILAIIRIILTPDIFTGSGIFLDFLITLIPIGLYFQYRKIAKNWGGQFIQWTQEDITYKTRQTEEVIIPLEQIQSIDIHLDEIKLSLNDMTHKTISLENFTEYSDRIKIKEYFNNLKNN